jgi:antitoxin (DNA-binding transcriptional repressor) of toxin-antitoxin stability system
MDPVPGNHETGVITKRGKPVAKLVPVNSETAESYNVMAGKGAITGDRDGDFRGRLGRAEMILADTQVAGWLAFDPKQFPPRARPRLTGHGRMRTAWRSAISPCWNWPRWRARSASGWTSACNLSGAKSSHVSCCCRSAASLASAQWTARELFQGSHRSHDRGYGAGRGACDADRTIRRATVAHTIG